MSGNLTKEEQERLTAMQVNAAVKHQALVQQGLDQRVADELKAAAAIKQEVHQGKKETEAKLAADSYAIQERLQQWIAQGTAVVKQLQEVASASVSAIFRVSAATISQAAGGVVAAVKHISNSLKQAVVDGRLEVAEAQAISEGMAQAGSREQLQLTAERVTNAKAADNLFLIAQVSCSGLGRL